MHDPEAAGTKNLNFESNKARAFCTDISISQTPRTDSARMSTSARRRLMRDFKVNLLFNKSLVLLLCYFIHQDSVSLKNAN